MEFCRICRSQCNLKYATQLQLFHNTRHMSAEKEYMDAANLGNICYGCEQRLLHFAKFDDGFDLQTHNGRAKTPLIVNDSELLFHIFYDNTQQEHQFMQQPQQQQQQAQPLSINSADNDVIEVLTSRENTPKLKEKIVAVIDLVDDNSCSAQETWHKTKIPECSLINNNVPCNTTSQQKLKRKCRKKYNDNELNILAKLNLVSSDSEPDISYPSTKVHSMRAATMKIEQNDETYAATTTTNTTTTKTDNSIDQLNIKTKTTVGKQQEKSEHNSKSCQRLKCAICPLKYATKQQLVHHLRLRHRDMEAETGLCERVRHAQDSALTIRLCYESINLFYECQMCGRIDSVFKQHKQHVIDEHTAELKCLRDPLLKKLQCPVCQKQCGPQYTELCRHLLQTHTAAQYRPFLKKVSQNLLLKRKLHDVDSTACVFQFNKRQHWYFQCRHCSKLQSSYFSHRQHINEKHGKQQERRSTRNAQKNNKLPEKVEKEPIKALPEKVEKKQIVKQLPVKVEKKPLNELKSSNVAPAAAINRMKRKRIDKQRQSVVSQPQEIVQPQKRQRKRKVAADSATVRLRGKLKKTPKQVPLQVYDCKYCGLPFKGFCAWNMHLIEEHSDTEFKSCNKCLKYFNSELSLQQHLKTHEIVELSVAGKRQRRKNVAGTCITIDENYNATKASCCKATDDNANDDEQKQLNNIHQTAES